MTPQVERKVIGRHGTVYSPDTLGLPANAQTERIKAEQHKVALAAIRERVNEDIEGMGVVALSDMRLTLGRAIELHEGFSNFVDGLSLEEVTAEYLATLTKKIVESDELSDTDYDEYLTGLAEFIPELARTA
jgi:hypothetical protein